jgi:hypothetical protein
MLNEVITPSLQLFNFSRSGHTFYVSKRGNWGLVNFQKSKWSTSDKLEFTVRLGIASTNLLKFFRPVTSELRPGISACHWQIALGRLLKPHKDWWVISANTSFEDISKEVRHYVVDIGLPEMDKYLSDEALRDLWLSGQDPTLLLTDSERQKLLLVLLKIHGPENIFQSKVHEFLQHAREKGADEEIMAERYVKMLEKSSSLPAIS